jgi:hypothetical protein
MRCACNRWGPGTTCEKPINTQASKELQDRLAAMRNERTAQDKMWDTEPEKPANQKPALNQALQIKATNGSTYTGGQ